MTIKRILAIAVSFFFLSASILLFKPGYHIAKTWYFDSPWIDDTPRGFINDASRLNQTKAELWKIPSHRKKAEAELKSLFSLAKREKRRVSISGARHSMGGHSLYPGGIVIDMTPFDNMQLDKASSILHVEAGAKWKDVIPYLDKRGYSVEVMQSNDSFSVGGSISVNCHGWQFNRPPIASTVQSLRLMLANGEILNCSRSENKELFSLALGGYGLFGIILDVDLQ